MPGVEDVSPLPAFVFLPLEAISDDPTFAHRRMPLNKVRAYLSIRYVESTRPRRGSVTPFWTIDCTHSGAGSSGNGMCSCCRGPLIEAISSTAIGSQLRLWQLVTGSPVQLPNSGLRAPLPHGPCESRVMPRRKSLAKLFFMNSWFANAAGLNAPASHFS
jgi:hypothetical protein